MNFKPLNQGIDLQVKKQNQLELKKNWKEYKLWKKKNYLMQWFESLPSSDESNITPFFGFLWERETANKVTLFTTQGRVLGM